MIKEMEQGWFLNLNEKIIGRKRIAFISRIWSFFGFGKTTVPMLYSMIKRAYQSPRNTSNMMGFSFPIDHDSFAKPEKYPAYFRLINGWELEKGSKAFLKEGPLFSENTKQVFVHSKIYTQSFLYHLWSLLKLIGFFLGLIASILAIGAAIGL
jgi:predicted RND superfamily exporter protein